MFSQPSVRRHVFHTVCFAATGLVTLLAGARSARAEGLPIVSVEGGVSSSKSLPGTMQLRAGWVAVPESTPVSLGGDLSLRLGAGGPRLAPLLRMSVGKEALIGLGTGFAVEAGPSFRLGNQVRPGGMVQLVGSFYGLQTSLWAEQTSAQRAFGVTAGVDLVRAAFGLYLLTHIHGRYG